MRADDTGIIAGMVDLFRMCDAAAGIDAVNAAFVDLVAESEFCTIVHSEQALSSEDICAVASMLREYLVAPEAGISDEPLKLKKQDAQGQWGHTARTWTEMYVRDMLYNYTAELSRRAAACHRGGFDRWLGEVWKRMMPACLSVLLDFKTSQLADRWYPIASLARLARIYGIAQEKGLASHSGGSQYEFLWRMCVLLERVEQNG